MGNLRFEREDPDGFYLDVKRRVDEYFRTSGRSRKAGWVLLLKGLLFGGMLAGSYTALLLNPHGGWVLLPLAVLTAVSALLLALNVGHDATHQVLPGGPRVNRFVARLCFLFSGIDGYLWEFRHLNSHHLYPNINGSDTDIDENPLVRLSPNQPWRWHFQFQHIYAPVLYLFAILHTTIWGDFVYLFKRQLANLTDIRQPPILYVQFALLKAMYFAFALVMPMAVLDYPWWQVVLGYLLASACGSLMFVFFLIGTHFSDLADFPVPDATGSVGRSWADHNMATACDWSPRSLVAHFLSGGVNAHASHHLFPNVCHTHYPAITRIIEETAAAHGYPYNKVSLWGMVRSHFRFLYLLGRRPGSPTSWVSRASGTHQSLPHSPPHEAGPPATTS
jgi:linoleoyl-CoA desaturase